MANWRVGVQLCQWPLLQTRHLWLPWQLHLCPRHPSAPLLRLLMPHSQQQASDRVLLLCLLPLLPHWAAPDPPLPPCTPQPPPPWQVHSLQHFLCMLQLQCLLPAQFLHQLRRMHQLLCLPLSQPLWQLLYTLQLLCQWSAQTHRLLWLQLLQMRRQVETHTTNYSM